MSEAWKEEERRSEGVGIVKSGSSWTTGNEDTVCRCCTRYRSQQSVMTGTCFFALFRIFQS